jgi:HipA-like protein
MRDLFRKIYDWLSGVKPLPVDETIAFKVVLGSLIIGTLRADKGEWVFTYSDDFRKQSAIKPIVDFPATDREYRSPSLWPFFALRIPSPKQPEVQEFIERMTEDKVNEGILLKEFGIQSIANPFRLVPV